MAAAAAADDFVIPTIDIGPYLQDPSSSQSARIIQDVKNACMTTGFFSLVGHGIPKELQQRVLKACETLFGLPLEEKKKLVSPPLMSRGYELIGSQILQEGTLPDLKEVMHQPVPPAGVPQALRAFGTELLTIQKGFYIGQDIPNDDERAKKHPLLIGANIFPQGVSSSVIKDPTEEYYRAVFALGCKIMEVLAKGLPYGDDIFDEFLSDDPICSMRLLHYPPQTSTDEKQLGAGAHTDFGKREPASASYPCLHQSGSIWIWFIKNAGAITLLMQDGAGGLEVLNHKTGEWIHVDPNPDAYVVNIGDMLSLWTKNIYKSNMHRVINKSSRDRYSVPFFFDGNADVKLIPFDKSEPIGEQGADCRGAHAREVWHHVWQG